jgi:hypothetical protein
MGVGSSSAAPTPPAPHAAPTPAPAPHPAPLPHAVRTRKGVAYAADGAVIDCLFCRIVQGREPGGAPLWYNDGVVAAFVPRTPAAALHFLIVPVRHVQNGASLTADDVPLLLHMHSVARQLLRVHGGHLAEISPLPRCAAPPTSYPHKTDGVIDGGGGGGARKDPSTWNLDFHWPPYNSIDHLHLHALHLPMGSFFDRITFLHGSPWSRSIDFALQHARSKGHAVAGAAGRREEEAASAGLPKPKL